MIQVGDIVRFSNKALNAHSGLNSCSSYTRKGKSRRGKQLLMKVIKEYPGEWNWRGRYYNRVVMVVGLHDPADCKVLNWNMFSTECLAFVRRPSISVLKTDKSPRVCGSAS